MYNFITNELSNLCWLKSPKVIIFCHFLGNFPPLSNEIRWKIKQQWVMVSSKCAWKNRKKKVIKSVSSIKEMSNEVIIEDQKEYILFLQGLN